MKLSISNIGWQSIDDISVYNLMKKYGYSGLEIAPTRIFRQKPYERLNQAKKWSDKMWREYEFVISSMQSIWFGKKEKLFGTREERKSLLDYTRKAIDFAETIGCRNIVFGCPRNRQLYQDVDTEFAIPFFKKLGSYAAEHNTVLGMEANPLIYDTNYINDTESALELIREVDSEGFRLNLDIGTMIQNKEEVSDLIGNVKLINHVHISEPELKPIKERGLHKEIKKILESESYRGFISIEMSRTDKLERVETALRYVKDVFAE